MPDPARLAARIWGGQGPGGERPPRPGKRRVWARAGRAHIEIRGTHHRDADAVVRAMESGLRALEGVDWAHVNPVLARVIVSFDGDRVGVADLVDIIDGVEDAHGLGADDLPPELPEHPGDVEPIHRALVGVAADAAGIGFGAVASLLRLPRLPVEAASATSLVEFFPPIRSALERRPAVEAAVAVGNAVLQGIGQGPLGLVVDAAHRAGLAMELAGRKRAWERA